jgi:hypothetical protein
MALLAAKYVRKIYIHLVPCHIFASFLGIRGVPEDINHSEESSQTWLYCFVYLFAV